MPTHKQTDMRTYIHTHLAMQSHYCGARSGLPKKFTFVQVLHSVRLMTISSMVDDLSTFWNRLSDWLWSSAWCMGISQCWTQFSVVHSGTMRKDIHKTHFSVTVSNVLQFGNHSGIEGEKHSTTWLSKSSSLTLNKWKKGTSVYDNLKRSKGKGQQHFYSLGT